MPDPTTTTPTSPSPYIRGLTNCARYLGLSERTLRRQIDRRLIPHLRVGNALLFRREEIDKVMQRLEVPSILTARDRKAVRA